MIHHINEIEIINQLQYILPVRDEWPVLIINAFQPLVNKNEGDYLLLPFKQAFGALEMSQFTAMIRAF